jgi:gamma-glutamyltranspeptidase
MRSGDAGEQARSPAVAAPRALNRPRFRIDGDRVQLEPGLWAECDTVRSLRLEPVRERDLTPFGGGQAILVARGSLIGGSESRQDGFAAGY